MKPLPVVPLILAGGSGTRLWPLSRRSFPKPFISLLGQDSLFQQTVKRVQLPLAEPEHLRVVCGRDQAHHVGNDLEQLGYRESQIWEEPFGRNTAPAVLLGIMRILREWGDTLVLVLPADHLIPDVSAFQSSLKLALEAAGHGAIVTLGIQPAYPETGFGYIEIEAGAGPIHRVKQFCEKPDLERAKSFVASGQHFWNAGIFVFQATTMFAEFQSFQPEMVGAMEKYLTSNQDGDYQLLSEISIDYAIMEKTQKLALVPAQFGWSDVGHWAAVHQAAPRDDAGNYTQGSVILTDCKDCYAIAENRVLAGVGLENLVLVETADAVMVAPLDRSQEVKALAEQVRQLDPELLVNHLTVVRPWGSFTQLIEAPGFKVKRLDVKPGKRLSLQMHHQRDEHWVVVRGQAIVVRGDQTHQLNTNDYIFISKKVQHRIENATDQPLTIIEVQLGPYLGEDDIVRFSDDFGRA
ncbi:MAG: mannose-1-phosphate guanylyltransferase/mannose-6-phosphate isomerase [Acidobacteria bacterium]|nr:mannose-1-phosphate guanylyltransferase/mannose-6-phosphate isomerase [Acidobacteriota bacterium]